jgi:hypothetical protein
MHDGEFAELFRAETPPDPALLRHVVIDQRGDPVPVRDEVEEVPQRLPAGRVQRGVHPLPARALTLSGPGGIDLVDRCVASTGRWSNGGQPRVIVIEAGRMITPKTPLKRLTA